MQLTWYGHSTMFLHDDWFNCHPSASRERPIDPATGLPYPDWNGIYMGQTSVLVDPFFEGNPLAPDWNAIPRPDIIAVTHDHADHLGQAVPLALATGATVACIVDLVPLFVEQGVDPARVVSWNVGGTVNIRGVRITMTPALHSADHGVPVGFVFEFGKGGPTVYHAGDTGIFGDMRLIGECFAPDVALLPVGGHYTMDGEQAARACALLGVKAAVPMHYKTFALLDATPDAFVEALKHHAPHCLALVPKAGQEISLPCSRN